MTANMKDTNSTVMPLKHTTNTTTNLGAVIVPLPAELAARILAFASTREMAVFRGQPKNGPR
jgi:hypothetical protein